MGTGLMTTTTNTTETQNWAGERGAFALVGVGGKGITAVEVTYSTKDYGIALGAGQLTITTTITETQNGKGMGMSIGKNIDISI